jgi:hypothetical protein
VSADVPLLIPIRHFFIFYRTAMSELWRNVPPTFSASAGWRCCAVHDRTAISRVFRAMASLLSTAELVVSDAGSIDTRTDVQQANGFLLAQEPVACDGCR